MWMRGLKPWRGVSGEAFGATVTQGSTYLAGLLLQKRELLDGGGEVRLYVLLGMIATTAWANVRTSASFSASGICWSASFEKSFSGLRSSSDMLWNVWLYCREEVCVWNGRHGLVVDGFGELWFGGGRGGLRRELFGGDLELDRLVLLA
jgi:hypothetical protein